MRHGIGKNERPNTNKPQETKMKKFAFILASLIAVSGCASMTIQEKYERGVPMENVPMKTGSIYEQYERDTLNCKVSAAQRVQPNLSISSSPGRTQCYTIGMYVNCYTIGGGTDTTDNNKGLRKQVYNQCVADKGWRFYDLPACPKGTKKSDLLFGPNNFYYNSYPRATNRTCYLPTGNGGRFWVGNLR